MAIRASRRKLADQVADAIVDLIGEQRLAAGDAIPNIEDLVDRFEVSRTVVREAIADLSARGILRPTQGRGTVVTHPGPDQLRSLVAFRMRYEGIDVLEVQELREALEMQAVRLAAERATDDQLREIGAWLTQMEASGDGGQFYEADVAFHRCIVSASGNRLLLMTLDAIEPLLHENRLLSSRGWRGGGGNLPPVVRVHSEINRCLQVRDAEGAAAAMRTHLDQARAGLRASLASRAWKARGTPKEL